MGSGRKFIGVDAGSVAVSVAEVSAEGAVTAEYEIHHGDVDGAVLRMLKRFDTAGACGVAATGQAAAIVDASIECDPQVSFIRAARHFHPVAGSLLVVGGEKFSLTELDADGNYRRGRWSSPCAAGTGSFLDQQAGRLGLGDGATLSRTALSSKTAPPKIASRCSVFAKTDLIHAQQQGHSIEAICDGLCQGLAANVVDTLFGGGAAVDGPIVFAGGVSRNEAVRAHISRMIGRELIADEKSQMYGSIGAALLLRDGMEKPGAAAQDRTGRAPGDLLRRRHSEKSFFHDPIELKLSVHPDFSAHSGWRFTPGTAAHSMPVEVDEYMKPPQGSSVTARLGIDVGSTSTKAVLVDASGPVPVPGSGRDGVIAGFYTRTAGRPLAATQALFESIEDWRGRLGVNLSIIGASVTGSGRKFIGAMVGADEVMDEISAHARAAFQLDPETDTIIEIGGQDSKFTTMRDGAVTLSIMNNVCAAGTGSFIEEQAERLSCPLGAVSGRTEGRCAPLSSDRCTVFMERDINHLLAAGYGVDEVLAAVLHSVRENYLHKVAREPLIGRRICFQGATAKNRSLVAAFEQRLGRPIRVSRYCHLTGAYGAALALGEKGVEKSAFRGIGLFRERIDVRGEACEICRNHCKLSVAEVGGEKAASGMLCGRDYSDARRLTKNRSGFDPIAAWRKHFHTGPAGKQEGPVVGIPAGLYLAEELPLWRKFFGLLNVAVMTSEGLADAVTIGKRLEGAEFCAPIAAFHAHVASLAGKADWIFAPFYMEAGDRPEVVRRNYCYYTQYAPSLAASMQDVRIGERLLTPIIRNRAGDFERMERLRETLKRITGRDPGRLKVALAWKAASGWFRERISALPAVMEREIAGSNDISVVLLGRPYTILSSAMNKGIPRIIGMHGVKCFTQDMLRPGPEDFSRIRPLLEDVHWEYASRTLLAAEAAGRTPGLYPVIVTSFKCAPDSCVTEPLRRIMDHHGKPYLVLQLDEHDAQTGYETRIEAALRTFKNHHRAPGRRPSGALPSNPTRAPGMRGRTVLLPSWDRCAGLMMAANFRREGIDARLLEEDAALISRAQRHNSGQCIPLNIIAEEAVEYMRRHGTDPEKTAVWIHSSQLGCNIGAFPQVIQSILDARGGGFEKASVYVGQMTASDVSLRAVINQYLVLMLAGWLRRTGCRIRPYEVNAGETDAALEESLMEFVKVFEAGGNVSAAVRKTADRLTAIRRMDGERPKVAVFGDLYARDNDVLSQDLVRLIERNGGEVITTPYTEYMKLISGAYIRKWFREGKYGQAAASRALLSLAKTLERKHIREFRRVLRLERRPVRRMAPGDVLGLYRVTDRHSGESFDNLLKVHRLIEDHPDIALFVQMSPAFCCPSLVTEAMSREIERNTGVPVVTITYDGTLSPKNGPVIPHLHKLQR